MRYYLTILIVMMGFAGISQARPVFGDGHRKQERPIQRKIPNRDLNKDKVLRPGKMAKIADRLARIKMAKTAFITRQLDLTPAQNEKFWPVYNQYQDELTTVQFEKRLNNSPNQANGIEQLTREDAIDRKIADIRIHYRYEFLKILPPEKVSMIYKSEKQFNDEMIKQLRDRKEEANN